MLTTTIEERLGQPRTEAIQLAVLSVEIDSAGGYSAYMQSLTARIDNMIVHTKSMIDEVDAIIASTAALIDGLD